MAKRIVIAIDGPAGAGKSSVAKDVAKRLRITYLDTGKMYRALTRHFLLNNIDINDSLALEKELDKISLEMKGDSVLVNGMDVTAHLRTQEINSNVSAVASKKEVRKKCVAEQRRIAANNSIVMDGRDIGSVVLPDATLKIYLDASIEERARRRLKEDGIPESKLTELMKKIGDRDEQDLTRKESPLIKVPDAVVIDSTALQRQQVVEHICKLVQSHI